jgi:hypothetical protein
MSIPKIKITHADGTVSTRQSKRPYLFGIVCSPLDPARYRAYLVSMNEKLAIEIVNLNAAIADPVVQVRSRGFGRWTGRGIDESYSGEHTFHNFEGQLLVKDIGDRWVQDHCDSNGRTQLLGGEGSEPVLDSLLRTASWYVTDKTSQIEYNLETIQAIDAGTADLGGYSVMRWTSRMDLGVAALGEFAHYTQRGHTLTITPVDAE